MRDNISIIVKKTMRHDADSWKYSTQWAIPHDDESFIDAMNTVTNQLGILVHDFCMSMDNIYIDQDIEILVITNYGRVTKNDHTHSMSLKTVYELQFELLQQYVESKK